MKASNLSIGTVYGMRVHPHEDPRPVTFEGRSVTQSRTQTLEFTDVGSGQRFTRATSHSIAGLWDTMVAKYTRPVPVTGTISEMIEGALDDANFIVKVQELEAIALVFSNLGITVGIAVVSSFGTQLDLQREPALFIRHQDAETLIPILSTIHFKEFDELEQRNINDNLK